MNLRQHHVILPLCSLILAASLASCAPTMQATGQTTYRPTIRSGAWILLLERVNLSKLTDTTPETSYIEFPECGKTTVVLVKDVRAMGVEQAQLACQAFAKSQTNFFLTGLGIVAAASLIGSLFFVFIIDSIIKSL